MRIRIPNLILVFLTLALISCNPESDAPILGQSTPTPSGSDNNSDWLIPVNTVLSGGPGKDGIPSIDNPNFADISSIDYLLDDDLVIGVKVGSDIRAYPHPILDWHEIVNDDISNLSLAVTYCPLTGTAVGWNREVDGEITTFGVSGLLHNSNLIPYDRATDSNWSQMRLDCVNGERIGRKIKVEQVLETSWRTWKQLYPNSQILTTETGFNRSYGRYPYGSYKSTNSTNFPITNPDNRRHAKERVLGVIVGFSARTYSFDLFRGNSTAIYTDRLGGEDIVIIGNETRNFILAFNRLFEGTLLEFTPVEAEAGGEAIFKDNLGNLWNVFGEAVSGPNQGAKLDNVISYIGYWFAWATFEPEIEIFTP